MKAYTLGITKDQFIKELKDHQAKDNFLRGTYEEMNEGQFKGCAVGCSLESVGRVVGLKLKKNDHQNYETYLAIPEWLARVEDRLFEGISLGRSKTWPVEFAEAINTGADLDAAKAPFIIKILERNLLSLDSVVFEKDKWPDVVKAIEGSRSVVLDLIRLWKEDPTGSAALSAASAALSAESAALSAESAGRSAALSAESAGRSAALSAESAALSAESAGRSAAGAAMCAASAAWSAAWSAASAAWSAASAALSAAWSAAMCAALSAESAGRSAESAGRSAAWSAASAESETYGYFADELLKILTEIKT